MRGADQVIATGGEGHAPGAALGHLLQQMGMQLTTGMERHGVMVRGYERPRLGGEGVGLHKLHAGTIPRRELPPLLAERALQFEAQDLGPPVQGDQAPQVALAGAPLQIGALMGGQATGEGFYLRLLAPRHVHRHGPGTVNGLGDKGIELAQGMELGPCRDPGGKQGAQRSHVAVEPRYLVKAEAIQAGGKLGGLGGEGQAQMMIGLVLPPASFVGQQAIQLSKTVSQHGELVLLSKREAHSSDLPSKSTRQRACSTPCW